MKKMAIAILVLIAILVGFNVASAHKSKPIVPTEDYFSLKAVSIEAINAEVNRQGSLVNASPLAIDQRLTESATKKAEELASGNVSPDNPHINLQGVHGWQYIRDVAPECVGRGGENLVTVKFFQGNHHTSSEAVDSWMTSKPHREAMLATNITIVGYAIRGRYVVQHMC